MPSRAVLRKKARREAKRSKTPAAAAPSPPVIQPLPMDQPQERTPARKGASSTSNATEVGAADSTVPATVSSRKRGRAPLVNEEELEGLSRKERRRLETERRLQRQMSRLETAAERAATEGEDGEGPSSSPRQRHDPRFTNGTFWRDRKEKRARSVFLGGIPAQDFSKSQIEELITSTLRKDSAAASYLSELDSTVSPLSEIDYLPVKHESKFMLRSAVVLSVTWGAGDAISQWWEFRERHLNKDLDFTRMGHNACFGALSAPFLVGYSRVVVPRVFGRVQRAATPTLMALAAHQLVLTPGVLLAYFNYMTAVRGGLGNTGFMNRHQSGASRRHTVMSIEKYMFDDVIPVPLLASWGLVVPAYAVLYSGAWGRLPQCLLGVLAASWCGLVSYTQTTQLL